MKYHLFTKGLAAIVIGLLIATPMQADKVEINEQNFPDKTFRKYVNYFDIDNDHILDDEELGEVTRINVKGKEIKSLGGIEYFTELKNLYCQENQLTELDLTNNTKLEVLECQANLLTSLDVTKCKELMQLFCHDCRLETLAVSGCTKLFWLLCDGNQLTALDLTNIPQLYTFGCSRNKLTELDLTNCKLLDSIGCQENQLTTLDLSNCPKLRALYCNSNKLTAIDLINCPGITALECYDNQLTALDLTKNDWLHDCFCQNNRLTSLKFNEKGYLRTVFCEGNQLTGAAMDQFIASLPKRYSNGQDLTIHIINSNDSAQEHNVCTTHQVNAIKAKGWNVYHLKDGEWTLYMGYPPFIEDGKVWKVGNTTGILDTLVQVVDRYYFDGDTIIDGKTCKQMMCQRYVSPNYSNEYGTPKPSLNKVGAWYEEGKKVYFYDEIKQSMRMMYDFSLGANDTLTFLNVDGYPPYIIGPKQTGGLEGFNGVYREIMIGLDTKNTIWLEGVGGLDAPTRNAYDPRADRQPEFLMSCTIGNEVIYLNSKYKDGTTMKAQDDYHPLIEEGKVWTYHYQGFNGREFKVGRVIDGDTIIGGLTYKKIYDQVGGQYQYALREGGKKVYIVYSYNKTASLLYDFGKNAGDVIDELAYPLIVASVDTIDIDSVKFRRMRVQDADKPVEKWSDDLIHMYNFWIEGVGSESLLEKSIREPGNAYNLLSCQINGRVYTQQELLGIASKPTPQDDYLPFVEVGKRWNVIRSDFDGGSHRVYYRLTNEKVEKSGKIYMKMSQREDYLNVDERLLREENRKVYIFDSDIQKEFLLFDYSLKAGDTYETYSYDDQKMVSYKVLSVSNCTEGPEAISYDYDEERDSMITQRRYLRKWTVCRTDDNSIQKTWIESVGSFEGPLANLYDARPISYMDDLAYVEDYNYYFLPFSFHNEFSHVHGCNLPTGAEDYKEDDERHKLTYELEGNRLHVYGKAFTQCGPNNYAFFYEKKTDDPLVNKIQFVIQEAEPLADCMALHATNFYVPGFDPNMNYIVVDNYGEEHPVINKTPQIAYRPFIEEGKVWKAGDTSVNPVQLVAYYYFDGDTIINGKVCKQMMCQRYYGPDYHDDAITFPIPALRYIGAWYEEDKKVYYYDINNQLKMMYDFALEANDTLLIDIEYQFVIGPKQTGDLKGFKGVYRDIKLYWGGSSSYSTTWLEGVGSIDGPTNNIIFSSINRLPLLMSCIVGDEVIYLNDEVEDGATPEGMGARKNRFDFTHTIKTKPKARKRSEDEPLLYGEYNDLKLGINLNPLDDAYQVRITDDSGKVVYEKVINAGNIVGLNIDISAYAKGRYTVTVENSEESFTGEFNAQGTGIESITSNKVESRPSIYNLQGQRLNSLQKGLNIVNGQKIFVK